MTIIIHDADFFSQEDEPTLLLYLLLLKSSSFRNYVFAATDIDQLVLPILKVVITIQVVGRNLLKAYLNNKDYCTQCKLCLSQNR